MRVLPDRRTGRHPALAATGSMEESVGSGLRRRSGIRGWVSGVVGPTATGVAKHFDRPLDVASNR